MTQKIETGIKVRKDGYDATIKEVCTGQLKGMVVLQLSRGQVCISIHDLKLDNPGMF